MRPVLFSAWAAAAVLLIGGGTPAPVSGRGTSLDRPAPEFPARPADAWIGSSPLTIAALKGKVVLLDVWTFG